MTLISNVIKALQLIDQQGLGVLRSFNKGYSLSSNQIVNGIGSYCNTFGTIIDVGANQGQFAIASNKRFPTATVISFEPLPELYDKFRRHVGHNEKIIIHNVALGNEKGVIDFYRNEHSHASSALIISERQKIEFPETSKTTKVQVQVNRLDDILAEKGLVGPILLKLDVQGYEKRVLEGATSLLPHIDYIVFETSFISMYEGEPLFDEMHTFLKSSGFELLAPVGLLEGDNSIILQIDFLYRNGSKESGTASRLN